MVLLGKQTILTLEECAPGFISDPQQVTAVVIQAARDAGLSIIQEMEHRFEPQGLTLMLLLAQSHLIAHTWPEYGTLIVDVFVCVPVFAQEQFTNQLQAASGAKRVKTGEISFAHYANEGTAA